MENEQMKQPTYEELSNAYQQLVRQYQQLESQIYVDRTTRLENRLKILLDALKDKDAYSNDIRELMDYHVRQILAKPDGDNR